MQRAAKMLFVTVLSVTLWASPSFSQAQDRIVAQCGAPSGWGFYPSAGIVPPELSGWRDERMTGGRSVLMQRANGTLDIVFRDATGATVSWVADGGELLIHRVSERDLVVVVAYPGRAVEIWHYIRQSDGKNLLMLLQSKGGHEGGLGISKASVMVGDCAKLDLEAAMKLP